MIAAKNKWNIAPAVMLWNRISAVGVEWTIHENYEKCFFVVYGTNFNASLTGKFPWYDPHWKLSVISEVNNQQNNVVDILKESIKGMWKIDSGM